MIFLSVVAEPVTPARINFRVRNTNPPAANAPAIGNPTSLANVKKSIKTEYGSYTPDFEFPDFYVDVKCNFTYDVLIGKKSYSKKRRSNPKQLEKIKWISSNLKKIKIAIIEGESLKYIDV
jgi:hypothetical protein